jgi:hypothetical protein
MDTLTFWISQNNHSLNYSSEENINNILRMSTKRISGLQKDVFALYRCLLRISRKKNDALIYIEVKRQFRETSMSMNDKEIKKIEHFIRYGYKQKTLLEMPGFRMLRSTGH